MAKKKKKKTSSFKSSFQKNKKRKKAEKNKGKKQLWRLEDGVTFSSLSLWLECREQFALSYINGLTPKRISIPLEFGSIMHTCLEHQFTKGLPPEVVVEQITNQYRSFRAKSILSSSEKDTLNLILGLAKVTFPLYCKYWEKSDRKISWIKREEKFSVHYSLPTPTGSQDILLRGMRDGIFRQDGVLGVFETKTKSVMPNEDNMKDSLKNDMQTMLYSFTTFLETGEKPQKVLYNVIRRSKMYRRKEENLNSYLKRVEEDIKSRPEHYFQRWNISITSEDLTNFVNNSLNPILVEFVHWYKSIKKKPLERSLSPYHYQNYNALFGKYGRSIMFEATQGNYRNYTCREHPFPELSDSFQVE